MSLKELHACITDLFIEWHKEHPNDPYLHRLHSKLQILLDSYVCIPRKKLEEQISDMRKKWQKHLDSEGGSCYCMASETSCLPEKIGVLTKLFEAEKT